MALNLVSLLSSGYSGMYYSKIPPFSMVTKKSITPFELTLFTTNTSTPTIDLYSQFSNSRPYQDPQNRYEHLLPQWEFLDSNNNVVNSVIANTTYISANNQVIGLSGTAQFYYKDDMPSTQEGYPVLLWATLQTSGWSVPQDNEIQDTAGYSNSKIISVVPYYIQATYPHHLEITRNGKDNIIPLRWQNVEFPYFITIHGMNYACDTGRAPIIFDYPQTNAIGSQYAIDRYLISGSNFNAVSSNMVEWNPLTQYFQRTDNNNHHIGGFAKGSVTPLTAADPASISAYSNLEFTTYPQFSNTVWIANPANNVIHKILYWGELAQTILDEITSVPLPLPLTGLANVYNTPYIENIDLNNTWGLTGFGGIFGIAIDPCNGTWCTDYEMDKIYKFSSEGSLISTIDLAVSGLSGYSPAGICLDGDRNVWVTIFDVPSALKYDVNGNHLLTIANPAVEVLDAVEDYSYKPGPIEADKDNNVWIGYANSLSSSLIKYDTNGTAIASALIAVSATPNDIAIDYTDNSIWVTEAYSNLDLLGKVEKYSSSGGNAISSFEFPQPSYITIDNSKTVWFTYGYQKVGFVTTAGLTGSYTVSAGDVTPTVPGFFTEDDFIQDEALGGIASNGGNIWIIQSVDNIVYLLSANPLIFPDQSTLDKFDLLPDSNLVYALSTDGTQYSYIDEYRKSAQAYGDWTGTDWIRKYTSFYPSNSTVNISISGVSNDFYILPFNNRYGIRRFNESWNAGSQIRSYALPEHINSNYNLWENYMSNMWGSLSADYNAVGDNAADRQSFGRMAYEKIANFIKNHSDVETSNINQLYSIAEQLNVPVDDYNFNFPVLLNRIMDIVSVPHYKLWGARCKCAKNFSRSTACSNCNHTHSTNLGDIFLPYSYTLTADTSFVVKPKFISNQYSLLTPTTNGPLSATASVSWLLSGNYSEYDYFTYIPTYCNTQVEGLINWEDQYTTLSENNSSLSAWYNDYGIIEEMISYYLHKGLGLNT